jgi:hypothetical protein
MAAALLPIPAFKRSLALDRFTLLDAKRDKCAIFHKVLNINCIDRILERFYVRSADWRRAAILDVGNGVPYRRVGGNGNGVIKFLRK